MNLLSAPSVHHVRSTQNESISITSDRQLIVIRTSDPAGDGAEVRNGIQHISYSS